MFLKQPLSALQCLTASLPQDLVLLIRDYARAIIVARKKHGNLIYWHDALPEWETCDWIDNTTYCFPSLLFPQDTPAMPHPVIDFVVAQWRNRIYVFGGVCAKTAPFSLSAPRSHDVQCYDCSRCSWSLCQPIPFREVVDTRCNAALVIGNSIFIIGDSLKLEFKPHHSHWTRNRKCPVPSFGSRCTAATVI